MGYIITMSGERGNKMVSDDEILSAFDEIPGPYVTATELEQHLPIGRHAITKRLYKLHEEGKVEYKQPIQQFIGWWRTSEAEEFAEEDFV